MAERIDVPVVKKGVKDLEEEVTCAICHEHYTEPKVLPCCHYYCKQCLHQLSLRNGIDKSFSCPECRKDTTLPEGGLNSLPTAFFVNRMKEIHSKLELAHGKVEAKCEMCLENNAEGFCRQCAKFICADCAKSHLKMKAVFPDHKVSTLDELREGGAENIVIPVSAFQSCEVHEEPMKIYCYDCKSLICRDCTAKPHRDHNHEFVKVAAPKVKQNLIQQLNPLRESCSNMLHAMDGTQTIISEVEDQEKSVVEDIESSFAELHKILDNHKQELLAEAATKAEQKSKHLAEQGKGLSIARAAVESVIDYTEHCVEHSADDEIMCMHTEIQSRINREIEEQQKERKDLEPVEEVDLGVEVNCAEDLKQLCRAKAKIIQFSIDATKCIATGEGLKSAEVSNTSQFEVSTHLSNGRPTKRSCGVSCTLKSLANDSTIDCHTELIKDNKYRIQYTPTVRGRHELIVTVNGQEVAGSPFPVFVSIHPTLLGKPVRVITCAGERVPWDVAVTTAGDIIVAEFTSASTYDKNGTNLRTLDIATSHLFGVAVDTDGCVYMAGHTNVLKLNSDFDRVGDITKHGVSNCQYVAVVGDEVMASEGSSNVVMVYTKDLKYVRQVGSHDDGPGQIESIRGVSSDGNGNLYVSDYKKGCVHVFSNGGEFLYSFGQGGNSSLSGPVGVCVDGQYVYVTNWAGHSVSVFTTEGQYVTSFGSRGGDMDCFNHPRGVCVDKDGFVYVCDNDNGRVQMF